MSSPRLPLHPDNRPFVLGHRGARAHAPENTLRAFQRALDDGADGVELDVRMTADGALRIAHDEEILFSGHDRPLAIGRLTSSQLAALTLPSGDSIPALTDALRFQAETGCLVNVELKASVSAPSWLCDRAAAEIRAHGGSGIVISSFSPAMVRKMATQLPHVPVALLFDGTQNWTRRLLPLGSLKAVGAHPQETCIDEALVERIHSQGAYVGAWTVNSPARALELSQMGVDVLIGDDPGELVRALEGADASTTPLTADGGPSHP